MYEKKKYDKVHPYFITTKVPSSTYKDKEPSLEDFGVYGYRIEDLKEQYEKYSKRKKRISGTIDTILGFGVICTWISPLLVLVEIIMQVVNITKHGRIISSVPDLSPFTYWAILFISTFILVLALKRNEAKEKPGVRRQKPHNEKMEQVGAFLQAQKDHLWWKKQKSETFWRTMDGRSFEIEVAKLFKHRGYQVKVARMGADGGVDIVMEKDGERIAVQCKAHARKISEGVARDLYGVLHAYNYNRGILVTLNGVSSNTSEFCKSKKDKPIDIMNIHDILRLYNNK